MEDDNGEQQQPYRKRQRLSASASSLSLQRHHNHHDGQGQADEETLIGGAGNNNNNNNIDDNQKVVRTVSVPQEEQQQQQQQQEQQANNNNNHDTATNRGGFVLACAGGERIQVSAGTAARLEETCDYFRNAFRHGTQESRLRVISKPDWKKETAEYIIHLIEQGKRPVLPVQTAAAAAAAAASCCFLYRNIQEAAQQILLPIAVKHPVFGDNIQNDCDKVQLVVDTWNTCTTTFDMDLSSLEHTRRGPHVEGNVWDSLLMAGTVFVDKEEENHGLLVEVKDDTVGEDHGYRGGAGADILRVGSFAPLELAVYHTCTRLSEVLRNPRRLPGTLSNEPACMALPLYLGARQKLQDLFHHDNIQILVIHADNVPTVEMTRCCAPLEQLQTVLNAAMDYRYIAPVHLAKLCYLLIPKPSCELLGNLIRACQTCEDNPGTIGWDLEKNQFCTLKTLRDTQHILQTLLAVGDDSTCNNTSSSSSSSLSSKREASSICLVTVDMTSAPEWSSY